jgi:hypothetical protein|tara:strand:+ start:1008 stop:1568 length:561 start_codon:yes stop_codon:yes gene_type:complete
MDNFNYKKYLTNNPLLEDLPKGKWVDLDDEETGEYAENIFDLIKIAYASIGGHSNYKSANDVVGAQGDSDYEVINLDDDPDIEAVSVSKKKSSGDKFVATGHDGSKAAKSAVINHKADNLKKPGNFIEVSGRIKDILLGKGVPMVTDEETIETALKGKDIKMNKDGSYRRKIAGKWHEKILLGNPL